jgi:hypothetical protein
MSAPFRCLIGSSFARRGFPRRDDPNFRASPGVDHDQDLSLGAGPEGDEPPFVLNLILDRDAELVAENGRRVRKVDLVLPGVFDGFAVTPLIPRDCMHARTLCQGPIPFFELGRLVKAMSFPQKRR